MPARSKVRKRTLALCAVLVAGCGLHRSQGQAAPLPPTAAAAQKMPVVPTESDKRHAFEVDADRLARLAVQLQAEVEHTRRDELSVSVVRTADEMERLARSARSRIH